MLINYFSIKRTVHLKIVIELLKDIKGQMWRSLKF